jgi:hypothetical protein
MECPHLVTCDGMHQNLIIWFWVKQMYGICFCNVAKMSIATLMEPHFLEAKVSIDSHSQDTIRTDTTFHQLWLCNTSICVCWFIDEWEHVTWCGRSAICQIHKRGLAIRELVAWLLTTCTNDVSLDMSTFSSAVHLANQSWITAWTHSFVHICGTSPVHAYLLPHLYKPLVTYCNSS